MTAFSSKTFVPASELNVRIVADNEVLTLEYKDCTAKHQRSLWWGTAVGYRAMQMAATALSEETLWRREDLYVVSGHPGGGVLDSLNFVTGCRDNDKMRVLENPNCVNRCNSEMLFEWWVCDGKQTAYVKLRDGYVPKGFYELMDRQAYNEKIEGDDALFELYKVNMSSKIWVEPLERNFSVQMLPPLENGEIPTDHVWYKKTA